MDSTMKVLRLDIDLDLDSRRTRHHRDESRMLIGGTDADGSNGPFRLKKDASPGYELVVGGSLETTGTECDFRDQIRGSRCLKIVW
jgi:hypothetical protein